MTANGRQTIIIPIDEVFYNKIIEDVLLYKKYLDSLIASYPELFPIVLFTKGYTLNGFSNLPSKCSIKRRRILVGNKNYLVHPCFMMPYLRAKTSSLSKGLYLRKQNVSYDTLSYVFGRNPMYWYRVEMSLAANSLVGTTIKSPICLPAHIVIDEHHDRLNKQKLYIATTVGHDCILGAVATTSVDYLTLKNAYGVYLTESHLLADKYCPTSVNIDGFKSTHKATSTVFSKATIIRCFFHGFLKIKRAATKFEQDYLEVLSDKVWACYHSTDKASFAQRIRRLEEWTTDFVPDSFLKDAVVKLCQKKTSI